MGGTTMGFMQKVKQFFGIGGIDVMVQCEPQVSQQTGLVNGQVTLSAKSDQHVLTLDVKVVEEYTTGRGADKDTEEYQMGMVRLGGGFDIKAGEQKLIPFQVPFDMIKSNADELKDMGGGLGKLGAMAKFANAEKSEYFVEAECDVQATAFDPSGKQQIQIV